MPRQRHFFGQDHYHGLTVNNYRQARIFDSEVVATVSGLLTVGFSHVEHSHRRSTKSRGGAKGGFALTEGPTVRKPLTVVTRSGLEPMGARTIQKGSRGSFHVINT